MGGFREMGGYVEMVVTENGWLQQVVDGFSGRWVDTE
jgi:hypothetical protein